MSTKLTKSIGRLLNGTNTPNDLTALDEARVQLIKELLPYWAGYKSYAKNAENEPPLSKQQKKLKERLEEFLSLKNTSPDDFKLPLLSARESPKKLEQRSQVLHGSSSPKKLEQRSQVLHGSSSQNRFERPKLSNIVFSIATGIRYKDERTLQREESQAFSEMNSLKQGGKSSTLL